jgi:glycosyltransferase involved in cell wall biosynthesis
MSKISIIIPCYFNEENIPVTSNVLLETEPLFPEGTQFEYVFVDDGSKDRTLESLKRFYQQCPEKVKVIKLAGNVGSYNAIVAGMEYATGECCVVLTADLQDPPELIPQMFAHWQNGIKLVIANRSNRNDGFISDLLSRFYYLLFTKMAFKNLPKGGFDLVLFDRQLKEEVLKIKEKNTNSLSLLLWLGYEYVCLPYERQEREIGTSRWTFSKKLKLFIDTFVAFSFFPIRVISVSGILLGLGAVVYALFIVTAKIFGLVPVKGWSTLMVTFLFVSSFQMIAMGILGEYLWRCLDASRNRPMYVVEEVYAAEK